jgi:hypothetical protein
MSRLQLALNVNDIDEAGGPECCGSAPAEQAGTVSAGSCC